MTYTLKKGPAVMSFSDKPFYTSDDYWSLPENYRAELIHGHLYDMASPNRTHQKLITAFVLALGNYISCCVRQR